MPRVQASILLPYRLKLESGLYLHRGEDDTRQALDVAQQIVNLMSTL
jgi:hypothetical protein